MKLVDWGMAITLQAARAAKTELLQRLEAVAGVVGVGITRQDGVYAVKVNLASPDAGARRRLPRSVAGVPVVCAVVGRARKR